MKKSTKRWLSALLALTMTASALPLEAGAFSLGDLFGGWTPPSMEDFEKVKEEAEAKLKERLGDRYESYNKLKDSDFSADMVDLTVKAEGLSGVESITATITDGTKEYPVELTADSWTNTVSVPLFRGELSYENEELSVPQVIDYDIIAPAVEGFEEPTKQDFKLDFDWTEVGEDWKPAASATLTYKAEQTQQKPSEEISTQNPDEPQTTSFTAAIQWADETVPEWMRPPVTVQLLADGQPVDEVVLSAENQWSYTWTELPVTAVALLSTETTNSPILYGLKYEEPNGYSLTNEDGLITARLAQDLTVPLDALVIWEHGENTEKPTEITLNIGENEKKIEDAENTRGDVWYEELGAFDLLDDEGIIDYSKAVSVDEIQNYTSTVLTFPWYSAGTEDVEQLKSWLLSLIPSEAQEELAELPTLDKLPQTYAEGRELRWLTVVWNSYEAPQTDTPNPPPSEPVAVDVLTIWNDRGVEEMRPASISYKLVDQDNAEQSSNTISVNKGGYVSYDENVLSAEGTMDEILALKLLQSFDHMELYDREVLLLKIPSSGVDASALSMMSVSQLKDWAAQQDAEQSGSFKLLAVVVNSRHAFGSLTVYKDVQDIDGNRLRDNTKFTYNVKLLYPDLSSETKTVEISEEDPLVLKDLPVGTRYTVQEEGRYGYISEDIDCMQSGVIKEGGNSLTFVNRKFNLIVRMDWVNSISWLQDDVRVYVDDHKYNLGTDNLWTAMDYASGISDLRYRDLAVRGLPEGYEEDYSIRWKNHVAIVTVSAEYDYDYEVEDDWKDTAEDDEYRVLAKVVWVGGDEEKRPTVSAQLYRDGKAYRDVATLKSSKNSLRDWRYVWEDVKGDEDNDWNVKVTKVPAGYSCEVTKVKDNYFIITCRWSDKKENV